MATKITPLLKSIKAVVAYCEGVPELRRDVARLKNFVSEKDTSGELSSAKVHKMERDAMRVTTGIAI